MKLKNLFSRLGLCAMLFVPAFANATIITIDNVDAGFSASGFTTSSFNTGFIGTNYSVDSAKKLGDFAIWDPTSSTDWLAGLWDVEMIWTSGSNRSTNALVTIGGTAQVVDQTSNGGVWYNLGSFNFGVSGASVQLDDSNSASGKFIVADAVRFTLIEAAAQPAAVSAPAAFSMFLIAGLAMLRLRRK